MPTTVAEALVSALPYVQRWAGETVVVKYGGAAMTHPALAAAVMQDVVLLGAVGVNVVLVHGGGPAVSEWSERLGLKAHFVDGLRVTDDATMRLAQLVQVGGISRDIAAEIGRNGGRALGISGQDGGGWLKARVRAHTSRATGEPVDLGRVGDIVAVDASFVQMLLDNRLVPVVAPVAVDEALDPLNVNADHVAMAVAGALGAKRLLFLTDVPGIRGPDGEVADRVDADTLRGWLADGTVSGGMIPKAEACLDALELGVGGVTVTDGREAHAVLLELFTDRGVGTMVTPEDGLEEGLEE